MEYNTITDMNYKDLVNVLRERGEETLSEAYATLFETEIDMTDRTDKAAGPIYVHFQDGEGAIWFYGFYGFKKNGPPSFKGSPTEHVSSDSDLVPASRRLLNRIFEGVPGLRTKVKMILGLKGFDAGGIW